MTEPTIRKRKITDYTPDPANANKGTERGWRMVNDSLQEDGAGRSIVVAADGTIVAGNKTAENAVDVGITEVIEVETDGHQLVVVKRTDWQSIDDPSARRYAYRDNRSGQLSIEWDAERLLADLNADVLPSGLFNDDELAALLGTLANDDEWGDAFSGVPEGDRAPFQQITFTLHDEQAEQVKNALTVAKAMSAFVDSPNENSNGNALARACEMFLGAVDGKR